MLFSSLSAFSDLRQSYKYSSGCPVMVAYAKVVLYARRSSGHPLRFESQIS